MNIIRLRGAALAALLVWAISLSACAHAISARARAMVDKGVPVDSLFRDPEAFKGRTVMLGGIIASTRNEQKRTYIEVVQLPLDYRGRPKNEDVTEGRFIVEAEGYLDPAIYARGREITVVGVVLGRTVRPLGDIEYSYLLLRSVEIHLFEPYYGVPFRFGIGIGATF